MKLINKCRICGNSNLRHIFSLGNQALTGVFPSSTTEGVTTGPVDLVQCTGFGVCELVQLKQSYELDEMYGDNYGYRSGLNPSMVDHLTSNIISICNLVSLKPKDLVIDIGSNDGTALLAYKQGIYSLVGIDPTAEKFKEFYPPTINLIADYFSSSALKKLTKSKAKVITSFSMFYDLEDPVKFAKEVASVLDENGVWVFEQSYLPFMLKTNSFDTICHEHLEFYCLKQIKWICDHAELKIINIELNDVNGGSILITASKKNSTFKECKKRIENLIDHEKKMSIFDGIVFIKFKERVLKQKLIFLDFLNKAKQEKKLVGALGASTKGNVLLQYYGITADLIFGIGEVNKDKFGRYTPGTYIPLISEDDLLLRRPDYLVVLPWHFKKFFVKSTKFKNMKLVFPLPEFEVVEL